MTTISNNYVPLLHADTIRSLPKSRKNALIKTLTWREVIYLNYAWGHWASDAQIPPQTAWAIWLFLGGRGAGKTRAGAEWIRARVRSGARHIALIAPSYADAREVMIHGESGLLNVGYPSERPRYEPSRRRLLWPKGAIGHVFSSEDPDGLRGPQFDTAWGDEFCAWNYPQATLSNLRLGLRVGDNPQLILTTTPRPVPALRELLESPELIVSRASTAQNAHNLAPGFMRLMNETYGNTRLGRQELDGEILTDQEDGLWSYSQFDAARIRGERFELERVIVSIDPPVTSGEKADACGIIVAGLYDKGGVSRAIILHDATVQGLSPQGWASTAAKLWKSWDADYILAEVNQGGDMVKSIIHSIDPQILVKTVYASKGKRARAEPVAALYEQGRVKHSKVFKALEDEMVTLGTAAAKSGKSPDRADALVWAVTDLLLSARTKPRLRQL